MMRSSRNASRAAFTLLELVLVLMIVAVMLATAAPSLRGFWAGRKAADAAMQIVALTQYARSLAIADGRTYRLNLDAERQAYWITAQDGEEFLPLGKEIGQPMTLPEGMTMTWIDLNSFGAGAIIEFESTGRCDPGVIVLTDNTGEQTVIACRSASERYAVVGAVQ